MNNCKCSQVPPLRRGTSQSCTFPHVSPQKEPINCIPAGKKTAFIGLSVVLCRDGLDGTVRLMAATFHIQTQ